VHTGQIVHISHYTTGALAGKMLIDLPGLNDVTFELPVVATFKSSVLTQSRSYPLKRSTFSRLKKVRETISRRKSPFQEKSLFKAENRHSKKSHHSKKKITIEKP